MSEILTLTELQKEFARVAETLQKEQMEAYDRYVVDATGNAELVADQIAAIITKANEDHDASIAALRAVVDGHKLKTQVLLDDMRAGREAVAGQVQIKKAARAKDTDIRGAS